MAIKRGSKKKAQPEIPEELQGKAEKAFFSQAMSDCFKKMYDTDRKMIMTYLEQTDEVEIDDDNKTIGVPGCGNITFVVRSNYEMDKDKIYDLVESGAINIRSLIEIASINATKLKDMVGQKTFDSIATLSESEYLTLKATNEFKESVADEFQKQFSDFVEAAPAKKKPAPRKRTSKPVHGKKTKKSTKSEHNLDESFDAIKASESVDSDLADILGE